MKRSINSENIVVVTAIAIAVSLLASACGPGKMKTAISKGSAKVVKTQNEGETTTATTIDTKEEVIKAVQEKQARSTDQAPVDAVAVQELSERIALVKLNEDKDGNIDLSIRHLTKKVGNDQKAYSTSFDKASATLDEATNTVSFTKAISREMIKNKDGKLVFSETLTNNLPITASVTTHSKNFRTVRISETDAAAKKVVSVDLIIKSNDLDANVQAEKDENVLKLKDKKFSITSTQMYLSSEALLHEKAELALVNSKANRVEIDVVDSKDANLMIGLDGKINVTENTVALTIEGDNESLKTLGLNNEDYTAVLNSGDTVVISQNLALTLTNKKTSEVSNIALTIAAPKVEEKKEEEKSSEEAEQKDEEQAQTEEAPATAEATEQTAAQKNTKEALKKEFPVSKEGITIEKSKVQVDLVNTKAVKSKSVDKNKAQKADFGDVTATVSFAGGVKAAEPTVAKAQKEVKTTDFQTAPSTRSSAKKIMTVTATTQSYQTAPSTRSSAKNKQMTQEQIKAATANAPSYLNSQYVPGKGLATKSAVQVPLKATASKGGGSGQAAKAILPTIQHHNSK